MERWVLFAILASGCGTTQPYLRHTCCKLPVTVQLQDVDNRKVEAALHRAMGYWTVETGREMFRITREDPDVVVTYGHPAMAAPRKVGARRYGRIQYETENGCFKSGKIQVAPDLSDYTVDIIETTMRHELGHVLGLEDTMGSLDVMGRIHFEYEWPRHPWQVWTPQLDLLRATYGTTRRRKCVKRDLWGNQSDIWP